MRNKILMTLALLLTAVTGAWAGEEPQLLTKIYASSSFLTGSQTFDDIATVTFGGTGTVAFDNGWVQNEFEKEATVTVTAVDGYTITSIKIYSATSSNATISTSPFTAYLSKEGSSTFVMTGANGLGQYVGDALAMIEVYGYKPEPAEPAITVDWNASTKTGNFVMPAYDVEIAPIYAPVAQWAKVDNVDQLPTAIEGVYADTDAPLIVEGTVAFAGQSTEVKQGTVMYAVTPATETEAPALDAANKWSADVPTAKLVPDAGDVKVWYYIKGADAPEGEKATAENTFNDSEICATPITVTVLSNKFDIEFKAANDNTIETGKATVKVGDEAAEVKEGKLTGVKMDSKVTVTAKEGYKFRKVEVKKAAPATTVTWNSSDFYFDANPFTKDGVTLTPSNDMAANGNNLYQFGDNTFTTTLGKFTKIEIEFESTTYNFDGWTKGTGGQYQPDTQTYPDWWENLIKLTWTGEAESVTIKGKDVFGIHSITFTIQ